MTKFDNDRRVTRALWALRAYVEATEAPPISPHDMRGKQDANHVSGLLTDLMYYCRVHEIDFWAGVVRARINFEAEKNES